jgi:ubiquinone biosynthesis protein
MSDTFAESRSRMRLVRVYSLIIDNAAEQLVDRSPLGGFRRRMQRWIYQVPRPIPELTPPVRSRILIEELGPTYVKLGQIVSSQVNVLPDEWRIELDKLQNDVPAAPFELTREVLESELGAPIEELYASFEHKPLAAASLGQVYRATLHDGRTVAVKVQRPNIESNVRSDLRIINNITLQAEARGGLAREIGLHSITKEFGSTLLDELDYYAEAYNAQTLGKNLEGIAGVHVPEIFRELSSKRVLTQEFVSGVKISDVEAMTAAGLDIEAIGDAALQAAIKMLLVDGFFHADPHPGNLIVNLETGVVTFLDAGMVGELSLTQRVNLIVLLWEFVNGNVAGMGRQLRSLSVEMRHVDEAAFEKAYIRRMSRFGRGSGADLKEVLPAATGVLRDYGLRLDPQLTLALKAMGQASAFFTRLAPKDRPFSAAALEAALAQGKEALEGDLVKDTLKREAGTLAGQALRQAPEYIRGLLSWNEQIKKGRLQVYVNTDSLNQQVDAVKSITQSVIVAVLVAGGLIGSAIVATFGAQSDLGQEVQTIGVVGFVASLAVAVGLSLVYLTRTFRRRRQDFDPL